MKTTRLALESLEDRLIPSLTPVSPNAGFPFTSIVKIQVTYPDHQTYVGTGAMVDSFHVLTAAHVLYHAADGGYAIDIKVIPDCNGNSEPFGYAKGTLERVYNTFIQHDQAHPYQAVPGDMDIGFITLDRPIGKRTGWMAFGWNYNSAFAPGVGLNTAGYPTAHGYGGLQMEFSAGPIAGLSADGSTINYYQSSMTALSGQSGSPLWEKFANGSRVIYGVVQGSNGTLNSATRITPQIFNDMLSWCRQDPQPTRDWVSTDPAGTSYVSTSSSGGTTVYTFLSAEVGTSPTVLGSLRHASLDPAPATAARHMATPLPSAASLAGFLASPTVLNLARPATCVSEKQDGHISTSSMATKPPAVKLAAPLSSPAARTDAGDDSLAAILGTMALD
jgi:V8-like Glu-specific endopeptidase